MSDNLAMRSGTYPKHEMKYRLSNWLEYDIQDEDDAFQFPAEGVARRTAENGKAGNPVCERVWAKIVAESDALRSDSEHC